MPVFCIQLSRVVTDALRASVTIEAATQADAERFALANASAFSFEYTQQIDSTPPGIDVVSPVLAATTRPDYVAPPSGAPERYRLQIDRWVHPITGTPGAVASIRLFDQHDQRLAVVNDAYELNTLILDAVALSAGEVPPPEDHDPPLLPRFIAAVLLSQIGISPCDPDTLDVTCNED